MTDVGQARHYLFTPEMTALRPNCGRPQPSRHFPQAVRSSTRFGEPHLCFWVESDIRGGSEPLPPGDVCALTA